PPPAGPRPLRRGLRGRHDGRFRHRIALPCDGGRASGGVARRRPRRPLLQPAPGRTSVRIDPAGLSKAAESVTDEYCRTSKIMGLAECRFTIQQPLMIGVSDLQYSYSKVTTASAGGLNFSRFNLPRSSRVECLGEARWAPSQDPLRPRAHWDPRGWNARRPRRRRPAPTGPGTELAWQRPILCCGGP